ncbi:major facilitator superfamily domain-containing protein [Thelephora terrestris]|uniref:Major facilitator superfamily domain-containing protein n=1 Tax=Thelephora terrestris TaxID=56493 RepID=A0A9P6HCB5_9AGAM|nr:major facilitator superfamily domain-containing protein [Thelephora terrestris]
MEGTTTDSTILNVRRTTTFLVSLLVALCSGTNYVYSAYGPQLGSRLRLSHTQQNLVGLSGNLGVYGSAPFVGKLADSRGPRLSLTLSFFLLLTGYLGIRAVYDASEDNTKPAGGGTLFTLILFEFLSGMGSDAGYFSALKTVARSFPNKIRTTVIGIIVSGFGLSAFIFSTIAQTIFLGNTSGFLLTLALGTACPMVLGWFLVRPCPYPEHAAQTTIESDRREEQDDTTSPPNETTQLISKSDHTQLPSITGLTLMRTIDFWVLFWIMSLLIGSGIMWINNVGLMARALALKENADAGEEENVRWQTLQVSTLSIASCVGRILIGVTADFANHRGTRRARCLSIVAASFVVSQLVGLGVQDIKHLQYAVVLVGISYGGVFGLLPTIIIEWFGMDHFSENWGLVSLSPLVMGNIFSMVFGRIFDAHSSHSEHGMRCFEGARCYSASLYMTTLACLGAFMLAVVAAKRDQKYG